MQRQRGDVQIILSKSNILNIYLDPPVVVEDRQLMVLAAHVAMMMRRLTNVQWRGQPTVAKAEVRAALENFETTIFH